MGETYRAALKTNTRIGRLAVKNRKARFFSVFRLRTLLLVHHIAAFFEQLEECVGVFLGSLRNLPGKPGRRRSTLSISRGHGDELH